MRAPISARIPQRRMRAKRLCFWQVLIRKIDWETSLNRPGEGINPVSGSVETEFSRLESVPPKNSGNGKETGVTPPEFGKSCR